MVRPLSFGIRIRRSLSVSCSLVIAIRMRRSEEGHRANKRIDDHEACFLYLVRGEGWVYGRRVWMVVMMVDDGKHAWMDGSGVVKSISSYR